MSSQYTSASGRRRQMTRMYSAEDQALNQISTEAEARLAAKRAARAEAREIRRYEIERQQREREASEVLDKDIRAERVHDLSAEPSRTRNSSGDSTDGGKDIKGQLRELNDKYKKSMMTNAQLDNEKQALIYQVNLLQDKLDDQEEEMIETQRQYKDKCKELDLKKRAMKDLDYEFNNVKVALEQRDRLLQESGLVIVATDDGEVKLEKGSVAQNGPTSSNTALLSTETIESLGKTGDGSLDDKLKKIVEDRNQLMEEVKNLKNQLEEEKGRSRHDDSPKIPQMNGPEMQLYEIQREASKQIHEYKLKLQKADQDIATLEGLVNRLETHVKRYKTEAETLEKSEDELKTEKRKLQKELREALSHAEEVQNQNSHLQKRIERLKKSRNELK